ncbi:acyltransferase family protein [Actinoallomurus acaciae]|uniref:Acyltransferase family protein n=1 Tax=Actinoallomurus acaciae TaxID=502577 RepID=A0ABV5Z0M9_9ACTN
MYTSIEAPPTVRPRLAWLDNLRVALTVLVVLHHAAQAYGPADWWYVRGQPRNGALATLSALDGAFFMSLFFFVSAVFVPGSYDRRGGWAFFRGRLVRLGIPLVIGALTIVPGLMYAYYRHYRGYPPISYPRYFIDVYLGLGGRPANWSGPSWPDLQFAHLWFIQNLLAYSLLYLLCRQAARLLSRGRGGARPALPVPGHRALILLTLAVAVATYAIRLRYPLDTWVPVLGFLQVEPARVPQYATFFILGVLAGRQGRLERLPARTGWIWLAGGLVGAALLFAVGSEAPCFGAGGATWPAALWALVDSALCVALCVGLLTLFRETLGGSGPIRRELAAGSYTVYIVHLPLVVVLQYALAGRGLPPLAAWGLVSVAALAVVFPLAAALRRLPGARRVL